ncbi:MAG: bifunctional adenosylcobinamide kinase/adenosylcobinamide-phosphate guanylyltransferase [Chloroflexota bacterium]|nr:bifunctional adenosylcobinamide kinase/adenosylcobinamide-phosphate guanylyltransferase [Chloroflexota bacterium]
MSGTDREVILILGGARSGKSAFAQRLASERGERVLFVATGRATDEEMQQRIELHQKGRPRTWRTVEAPLGVAGVMREHAEKVDAVLLDCASFMVANLMEDAGDGCDMGDLEQQIVDELAQVMQACPASLIIVSNEVGMGLVPAYPSGRAFRDLLGRANQFIAEHATEVYFMVAGIPQLLKGGR